MGRFASTVPFYERARQPYGVDFFATVARRLGFARTMRLIDLGTGPGLLAIGFAPFVGEIVGVDPEAAMLAAARAAAERVGVTMRFVEGKTETLPAGLGRFDVVTIGRALHWMEPGPTRAALDGLVTPEGLVAICSASSVANDSNPWLPGYDSLRKAWSDDSGRIRYGEHEAVMAGSRFVLRETIAVETRHRATIEDLCDRVLSMSSSSPATIGARTEEMRAQIRAHLTRFAHHGVIEDVVQARAIIYGPREP